MIQIIYKVGKWARQVLEHIALDTEDNYSNSKWWTLIFSGQLSFFGRSREVPWISVHLKISFQSSFWLEGVLKESKNWKSEESLICLWLPFRWLLHLYSCKDEKKRRKAFKKHLQVAFLGIDVQIQSNIQNI